MQLVMHQTSETTLDGAVREINRVGRQDRLSSGQHGLQRGRARQHRHQYAISWPSGNGSQAGDFAPGDRVVFAVSGSGQTVGTALYVFDDLPARQRPSASLGLGAGGANGKVDPRGRWG